jgi:hypothetical protein
MKGEKEGMDGLSPAGGRWLTPEQYAQISNLEPDYVKKLIWPNVNKKTCPKRIDERDLQRFSRTRIRIFYAAPNISGFSRPRLVERP